MYISKYNKFFKDLNEARTIDLPILDVVIDDNGNVLNGDGDNPLVKGRVERRTIRGDKKVTRILGTDNKDYLAGIDKNGNVIALSDYVDTKFKVLGKDNQPLPIPDSIRRTYRIKDKYYYNSPDHDYYDLIPIVPTGWVNVKIDMEIVKRVRRYSKSLGTNTRGHQSFIDKLGEFEKLSSNSREEQYVKRLKRGRIQKEMSCILLLQHINELKDFFNPSQSGFLFESFIAGLIPNSRIKEDNSPVDIKTTIGDRYQCKMVDHKNDYIEITKDVDPNQSPYLDYYIIASKHIDKIELFIIDGAELESRVEDGTINQTINYMTSGIRRSKEEDTDKSKNKPPIPKFKVSSFRGSNDEQLFKKFIIDLSDIDGRIKNLGESLKQNLDKIYQELSMFQFNVETIISGTDEKGVPIKNREEFDRYQMLAESNIKNLSEHLENLVADINK